MDWLFMVACYLYIGLSVVCSIMLFLSDHKVTSLKQELEKAHKKIAELERS